MQQRAKPAAQVRVPHSVSSGFSQLDGRRTCLTKTSRILLVVAVLDGCWFDPRQGFAANWVQTSAPVANWIAVASSADGGIWPHTLRRAVTFCRFPV